MSNDERIENVEEIERRKALFEQIKRNLIINQEEQQIEEFKPEINMEGNEDFIINEYGEIERTEKTK